MGDQLNAVAAVGQRLRDNGARVFTTLSGRGAASAERVARAGLEVIDDDDALVGAAELLLSIVPPGQAEAVASRESSMAPSSDSSASRLWGGIRPPALCRRRLGTSSRSCVMRPLPSPMTPAENEGSNLGISGQFTGDDTVDGTRPQRTTLGTTC